jgi:hypothetical protein
MYIIYKTTCLLNDKYYIGVHKTDDVHDDYYGSGSLIKRAIKKYGLENFKKEILFQFEELSEAYIKEAELVTQDLVDSSSCYNLKLGGQGGWDHNNVASEKKSERSRRGARTTLERHPWVVDNLQVGINPAFAKARKTSSRFGGLKHTEETRTKLSKYASTRIGKKNSRYGTFWGTDGMTNKVFKKDEVMPIGWYRGRV